MDTFTELLLMSLENDIKSSFTREYSNEEREEIRKAATILSELLNKTNK